MGALPLRLRRLLAGPLLVLPLSSGASAELLIRIDKASQRMAVSVNGQERHTWPVSTGAAGYDTPSGTFRPSRLSRHHFSREWDNAPMPFAIFFTVEGHAIHGTNQGRRLGHPASHGCVRLAPRNAGLLFALVRAEGLQSTQVVVEGDDGLVASPSTGPGIDPLAVLQQSAAARSRWQGESRTQGSAPTGRPGHKAAEVAAPGPAAAAGQASPSSAASAGPPPSQGPDRETLMSQLLNRGAQVAKPICSAC
ncbi:L,D-transpeptidase [Methylobacterium durans]|uniref:L,D-transpeptidase n=1 Tax=Methylobacterium durans TaxID=2202825 RepID=UPI002AFE8CCE|nr:L,D-transpeptidase [Methylobacterium durans]MEA1833066.1 L,D-transpeptidase [Methylobacterium durans]